MRIGIISDTHDNLDAINLAIEFFNQEKVDLAVHGGDFVSPFVSRVFEKLRCDLVGIFGNNDGDKLLLREWFKEIGEIHDDPYSFKLNDKNIIITHHPGIIDALAEKYEVVIYGHTHTPDNRRNKALIFNPGECCGWLSGRKTVGILDLEEMKAEVIDL